MTTCNFTIQDNSNESTQFGVTLLDMTSANHDATITAFENLEQSVAHMTLGALSARALTHTREHIEYTRPIDPYANRETAIRFTMSDDVGRLTSVALGAPNLALAPFAAAGNDHLTVPWPIPLSAELESLIDNLESYARHPADGTTLEVVAMTLVGRNL